MVGDIAEMKVFTRRYYLEDQLFPKKEGNKSEFVLAHYFYSEKHNKILNTVLAIGKKEEDDQGRVYFEINEIDRLKYEGKLKCKRSLFYRLAQRLPNLKRTLRLFLFWLRCLAVKTRRIIG